MRITCDVIRDLLPLYAENMVSNDTRALVEEHLSTCPECKVELENMHRPEHYSPDTNTAPFRKAKKKIFTKRVHTAVLSVFVTMVIVTLAVAYLTAPKHLPYSEDLVSVSVNEDGAVYLKFSEEVSGYTINRHLTDDGAGYVYSITTWESTWNKQFKKDNLGTVVINPERENVVSIYYYTADLSDNVHDESDILIYGKDLYSGGGVITLPRLFLAYYVFFAIVLLGFLVVLYWVFRKNEKARSVLEKALLFPVSYLAAHLCVKGLTTMSYSATWDFYLILLTAVPIYGLILLGISYYRKCRHARG